MKSRALAVCALALALLFTTHQAVSAPSSGCASVNASIVTGTDTVAPGTTIGIAGHIANCSQRKERYTVVVSAMSSCGQKVDIASSRIAFDPGEDKIWSVSYPMPLGTCAGAWEATVQVRDGQGEQVRASGGAIASATTTITIQ